MTKREGATEGGKSRYWTVRVLGTNNCRVQSTEEGLRGETEWKSGQESRKRKEGRVQVGA